MFVALTEVVKPDEGEADDPVVTGPPRVLLEDCTGETDPLEVFGGP